MRHPMAWIWIAAAGMLLGPALGSEGASSQASVGVSIVIPERTDLQAEDGRPQPRDPLEEAATRSPDPLMHRITSVVHDGDRSVLLITDLLPF